MARPHGREDSWTDAATGALIEAWGDRYLRLNRGILRQKDWKEIADAVNGGGGKKTPSRVKTDVQCKNRVDTLKKKYKLERSKPSPSSWPFFHRLEFLVSDNAGDGDGNGKAKEKKKKKKREPAPEPVTAGAGPPSPPESSIGDDGAAAAELARAVARLGEVYERVERSKQRTAMELERQRMEFSKEIEFQKLNMFMDAQLEMVKSKSKRKRAKFGSGSGSASGKK